MTWNQIKERIKRLEVLSTGLIKETTIMEKEMMPLHYVERVAYLEALHLAIRGLETARVALVQARHRGETAGRKG